MSVADDVEKYSESRFEFARIIARAFFNNASEMGPENVQKFAEYLDDTRCTAVFELLQRENQHVVNLSYLEKPELQLVSILSFQFLAVSCVFICF